MTFSKGSISLFWLFFLIIISSCFDSKISESASHSTVEKVDSEIRNPLYVSGDLGKSWVAVKNNLPAQAEMSFLEKIGTEIIAATDNVGLFISEKNKTSWNPIGKNLPSQKINALHVFGENIWVGPYRQGIFFSKNRGSSWENLSFDLPNLRVNAIINIDDQLLVGTDIGIFQLNDEKNSWEKKFNAVQVVSFNQSDKKLIAGTNQGVLFSDDKGENWNWIHRKGAAHNTAILDKKIIIMNVSGEGFISDDWGKTWKQINYFPNEASYIYETVMMDNQLVFSNNYGVHQFNLDQKSAQLIFENEAYGFFDFLVIDKKIYGATRTWKEYRNRQ